MEVIYNNKNNNNNNTQKITTSLKPFLTPVEASFVPTVLYAGNPDLFYTLVMQDSNAVTESHNVLHWVIVNIPGNKVNSGKTLLNYMGPKPPPNSGIHNYCFLLYEQRGKIESAPILERTISMNDFFASFNGTTLKQVDKVCFTSTFQNGGANTKSKRRKKAKRTKKSRAKKSKTMKCKRK